MLFCLFVCECYNLKFSRLRVASSPRATLALQQPNTFAPFRVVPPCLRRSKLLTSQCRVRVLGLLSLNHRIHSFSPHSRFLLITKESPSLKCSQASTITVVRATCERRVRGAAASTYRQVISESSSTHRDICDLPPTRSIVRRRSQKLSLRAHQQYRQKS